MDDPNAITHDLAGARRPHSAGLALVVLVLLAAAFRVSAIGAPPLDAHHVRQSDTASIARVMAREGIDLLHPRIDWAGPDAGTVESELPLYAALAAVGWRALDEAPGPQPGIAAAWARGISIAAWFLGGLALLTWVRRRLSGAPWGYLVLYALSPLGIVFSRNIQPDAVAVALLLIGLERADAAMSRDGNARWGLAVLAGAILGLAVAAKGNTGFWLPALLAVGAGTSASRATRVGVAAIAGIPAVAIPAAWFVHARTNLASDGASFGIWGDAAGKWGDPAIWSDPVAWSAILGTLVAVTLTPPGLLGTLGGLARVGRVRALAPFAAGVLLTAPAILLATHGFRLHNYYQLPLIPFASVLCGAAAQGVLPSLPGALRRPTFRVVAGTLAAIVLGATLFLGNGFVRESLRVDGRLGVVGRAAAAFVPQGGALVVVDRHPQTVLYASDRRGWARTVTDVAEVEEFETLGAEYLLVSAGSASYRDAPLMGLLAAKRPVVAQGQDWVLFRLYGVPDP